MRFAVISDIHSNLESLTAALALVDPADGVLCLGDIVGYGPNPNECMALVRERQTATVLGNHDVAAIDDFGSAYFNPAAREAMAWTQAQLDPDHRAWLDGLGYEFRRKEYLLVHGAPVNYFEYIQDKDAAARAFAATDAPLIFIGHTHVAEAYALRPGSPAIERTNFQKGGELYLDEGVRYIVNVGSVGQPRDLNPEASFGFYDPDRRRIEIVRYEYAIPVVQEKIAAAQLPPTLARRLAVGR